MITREIRRLWHHIPSPKRQQLLMLLGLMFFCSFAEIVSIGAVLPFLSVLTDPARVFFHPATQPILGHLGIETPDELIAPFAIAFGAAVMFAGLIRLLLLKVSTRLSFAIGADLSACVYERTLYQPFSIHISRNSSQVISGVITKTTNVIFGVIIPVLTMLNAAIMLIVISAVLLKVDPVITLAALGGFGFIYFLVIQKIRNQVAVSGQTIADQSTQVVKAMQEGLGGIRDVLLDGTQQTYLEIYNKANTALRNAQESNQYISQSPRYMIESLGVTLIAGAAYLMTQQSEGRGDVIPILGAFALGAQRLLPVLQQAFSSWTSIRGAKASLQDVLDLLDQPISNQNDRTMHPIQFTNQITLQDLSFRYGADSPWVLKNIELQISKGSRIGLIGTTGSGKSSLLDILMGLLEPTKGELQVDGIPINKQNLRSWQAHIAHVPQVIFLCDASISENIAFGIPTSSIDHERVRQAAEKAQIANTIESWDDKYETKVGERGVRLSGGQRQRIGIARALYKKADVIIFDEATSALDNCTEQAVMDAIDSLGEELTVFIVAHRLSTLRKCSQVIELAGGEIHRTGTYADIV